MKKIYSVTLILISLLVLGLICLNAGLFNGLLSNENTFEDIGTTSSSSNEWILLNNLTKTITDNGTILSSNADTGAYTNKPSTSKSWDDSFEWSSPFTVEFDIISWNGTSSIRIIDDEYDASKLFGDLGIKNGSHVKIVSDDTSLTYIVDGKSIYQINQTFTNAQIGFRLINSTIEYKNFKIY